jgi:hypothetical protein
MTRPSRMSRNQAKSLPSTRRLDPEIAKSVNLSDEYLIMMGLFQGAWASMDLTTDYAIWKFLNVTPEQAHLITSGMMFGRKARLLADLIGRSDHPNKAEILGSFSKFRGISKRDVFAHSYVWSDHSTVRFIDRQSGGEYKAKEHTFTLAQFTDHVLEVALVAERFYLALGATSEEVNDFGNASLSLNRRSKTSRGASKDKQ